MDLGYKTGLKTIQDAQPKVLYLVGADEKIVSRDMLPADCFVIYQGATSAAMMLSVFLFFSWTNIKLDNYGYQVFLIRQAVNSVYVCSCRRLLAPQCARLSN